MRRCDVIGHTEELRACLVTASVFVVVKVPLRVTDRDLDRAEYDSAANVPVEGVLLIGLTFVPGLGQKVVAVVLEGDGLLLRDSGAGETRLIVKRETVKGRAGVIDGVAGANVEVRKSFRRVLAPV